MIVSFRQTYGNDRGKLHEILFKDKRLIEFYNLCDLNIVSFHNCSKETIKNYKKLNKLKNTEYLVFNDIEYGECIQRLKKKLHEIKCTHFLFTQDDTFSGNNDSIDLQELINYVKSHSDKFMLSLQYNPALENVHRLKIWPHGNPQKEKNENILNLKPDEILKTFDVFHLDTSIFVEKTWSGMDDTPYICSVDFLDIIYDDFYIKSGNVWDCERYLQRKFSKNSIPRFITDKIIFRNYNFIGKTLFKKEIDINLLVNKNLY